MYNEPTKTNEAMKKTMKKFLSMAALALVGAVMTGCSSDDLANNQQPANKNNVVTLTTTVNLGGDGTRALTIDGNKGVKTFGEGDKIAVIYKDTDGNTQKAESEALTEGGGSSATFTVTLTDPKAEGAVRYIYPAAMAAATVATSTAVTDDATINYAALASQDGTLTTLASKYDLAVFDGSLTSGATLPASSTLANQLAILAYTIKNAGGTSDLTGSITRVTVSDGPNTYGVTRTAADGPVYIAIRPTSDATISIMATTGTTTYTKSLASKTYAANNIYKAGLMMTEVPDAIPGMFSTSSSGGKVYFSKGNLQAKIASYSSNAATASEWKFADSQYSYIGNAAGNNSFAVGTWVDLFCWVGASADNNTYGLITFTSSSQANHGNVSGESLKTDWGTAAASSIGTGWRTLSKDEWVYLFNTRTVNNGTGSGRSYTLGQKVNNVLGVVLYPDDYTGSTYSGSNWADFENAGCVFLPAAGNRDGTSVSNVGSYGYYWSSTANGTGSAFDVNFNSGYVGPASYGNRYYGFSVRLVRPVE